jgi:hypothetical protein
MPETDPSRAPDWRWQEAVRLANKVSYLPHRSEALIRRVINFLTLQTQARTSRARVRLQEKFPTIATVQRIRFDPRDGRRDAIEVRLVAGYPPEAVAKLSALNPAVVWTYLALFFDVCDRLAAEDFIWTQVIGFQRDDDGEQGVVRKATLWLSWVGGPLVADALLLPGRSVGFAEREEDVGDHLMETTQALITRAMALAPFVDRLDREQARQFTRWRVQASQQLETDTGDRCRSGYLNNVCAFLEGIELSFGRSSIPKGPNEKYHTSHVEPRAAELCAVARGEAVPELDSKILAGSAISARNNVREASDHQGNGTVS